MRRGRGKGKKQIVSAHDDPGSGEDDKISVKRRGRPQKPFRNEMGEAVEVEKIEREVEGNSKSCTLNTIGKSETNVKKRKSPSEFSENEGWVKVEIGTGTKANFTGLVKAVGYRQNGSRRKNKPRRAAEVGVECW